jgi:hypothetical protein
MTMKRDKDFHVLSDRCEAVIIWGDPIPLLITGHGREDPDTMAGIFFDMVQNRGLIIEDQSGPDLWKLWQDAKKIVDQNGYECCGTNGCDRYAFKPAIFCCPACEEEGRPEYDAEQKFHERAQFWMKEGKTREEAYDRANEEEEVVRLQDIADRHEEALVAKRKAR